MGCRPCPWGARASGCCPGGGWGDASHVGAGDGWSPGCFGTHCQPYPRHWCCGYQAHPKGEGQRTPEPPAWGCGLLGMLVRGGSCLRSSGQDGTQGQGQGPAGSAASPRSGRARGSTATTRAGSGGSPTPLWLSPVATAFGEYPPSLDGPKGGLWGGLHPSATCHPPLFAAGSSQTAEPPT